MNEIIFGNKELFSLALNIENPWRIDKIQFDQEKEELNIYVGYMRSSKFLCPKCGKECKLHDTKEKVWRHLNFFQYKTYIHCKLPRTNCEDDGVLLAQAPWSTDNTGFTMLFEEYVLRLAQKMPILSISKLLKESNGKIWRIVKKYTDKYIETLDFSNTRIIGIDETSVKGHNYITLFMDMETSKVMYIAEGKKSSTIYEFKNFFEEHKGKVENIEVFTCDMSLGFTSGIKEIFKEAKIVYDKFHVVKEVNIAVDEVRKKEVEDEKELKKSKYIWLKNPENLKEYQKEKLIKMSKMNLKTAKAYRLKLAFQEIYNKNITKEMAHNEIKEWLNWAIHSKLDSMKKVARMVGQKINGILNYFEYRVTNAVLEGTNSMIQNLKSRAKGYKVIENFKAMIYLMNSKDAMWNY